MMTTPSPAVPTKKITLPPVPGFDRAATAAPRKTPLELAQERRIRAQPEPVKTAPVTRASIHQAELLAQLRTGPKTAAEIGQALNIDTGRISTTLSNLRKAGKVAFRDRRNQGLSGMWSVVKGVKA